MLQFQEFDLKTGKTLTDFNPGGDPTPRHKEIDGEYLEVWLEANNVQPDGLYLAKYYDGVNDNDRQRRETNGKFLMYTSGSVGYFADEQTAKLVAEGDPERGIEPIYANSQRSAHNSVAYGSLPVSDGTTTVQLHKARVLVIDNEKRSFGAEPLVDCKGNAIPEAEIEDLLDKMGDGTMLTSTEIGRELLTDKELLKAIERGLEQQPANELEDIDRWLDEALGNDEDQSDLAQSLLEEIRETGTVKAVQISPEAAKSVNKSIDRVARQNVVQFRTATPNLPGMTKGTAGTSSWCERLGVDAIMSTDNVKGDDGRLKQVGIQEYDRGLWMNRKGLAEYRTQKVGMQVKVTVPEATLTELNPIAIAKAEEIASLAASNWQVAQRFVDREDRKQARKIDADLSGLSQSSETIDPNEQPIHTLLKLDTYGQMSQQSAVAKKLTKSLRQDRLDAATSGIEVPSATAQHHSKLEPWEICNRDLPHGAIVAYYRSPLPNVGAVAIGVNNLDVLKKGDPEAFAKKGAVYLNPWTAKNIAITDFDGDQMGQFIGGIDPDLPEKLRQEFSNNPAIKADRYELGRAALDAALDLTPKLEYSATVKEAIVANRPENKPMAIAKAKKTDHPWQEGESRTAATFRAWGITANNPTGKVASQAMVLKSFAAETHYIDDAKKPALLKQIAGSYTKIDAGIIPTDEHLESLGLPKMGLAQKVDQIVNAGKEISNLPADQKVEFATKNLENVRELIGNYADCAGALNLQTAVDTLKSSTPIDEMLQDFGNALRYKKHEMRSDVKKEDVYLGRGLKNNVSDPVGFLVDKANEIYENTQQLQQLEGLRVDTRLKALVPVTHSPAELAMAGECLKKYDVCLDLVGAAKARLKEELPEDLQPTISITTPSGKSFVIQRTVDADREGNSPVWSDQEQSNRDFEIVLAPESEVEKYVVLVVDGEDIQPIGYVTPESAEANKLDDMNLTPTQSLCFKDPQIEFHPPYALQNDKEELYNSANQLLDNLKLAATGRETEFASALWHHRVNRKGEFASRSEDRDKEKEEVSGGKGMSVAIRMFSREIGANLDRPPVLVPNELTATAKSIGDGEIIALRVERNLQLSLIEKDGTTKPFGAMKLDQNAILDPGIVLEAKVSQTFIKGDKIRVATEIGEFVVNPSHTIAPVVIPDVQGEFEFNHANDPNTGKKRVDVYLNQKSQRTYLGHLGLERTNKPLVAQLETTTTKLNGKMSRNYDPDMLKVEVISRIDRHDVAEIDKGTIIPLPDDFKPSLNNQSDPDVYHPTVGDLRAKYQELMNNGEPEQAVKIAELGKQLIELHEQPWTPPKCYSHPQITLPVSERPAPAIVEERYQPTIGELRNLYREKSLAGNLPGALEVAEMGKTLAAAYEGELPVPSEYSSELVSIPLDQRDDFLSVNTPQIPVATQEEKELQSHGR